MCKHEKKIIQVGLYKKTTFKIENKRNLSCFYGNWVQKSFSFDFHHTIKL